MSPCVTKHYSRRSLNSAMEFETVVMHEHRRSCTCGDRLRKLKVLNGIGHFECCERETVGYSDTASRFDRKAARGCHSRVEPSYW